MADLRSLPDELEGRRLMVEDGGLGGGEVWVLPELAPLHTRAPDPLKVTHLQTYNRH